MRKNINIIIILAVIAIIIFVALSFMGMSGTGPSANEPAPEGSLASAQVIMQELQSKGSVSELRIADIVVGEGEPVASGDAVAVHYTGILADGTVFDSSSRQGQPFPFVVGTGYVIPGWDQGLLGMKEGGKRLLVIPSDMAYGPSGRGSIPPNATLVFEVELVKRISASEIANLPQE